MRSSASRDHRNARALTIGIEQVKHAIDDLGEVAVAVLSDLAHARHETPDALVKRGAIHQPAGRVVLESFERLKGASSWTLMNKRQTNKQRSSRGTSFGLISPRPVAFRTASRLGNWRISVSSAGSSDSASLPENHACDERTRDVKSSARTTCRCVPST